MAIQLLSYSEASEQVQRFILARAAGDDLSGDSLSVPSREPGTASARFLPVSRGAETVPLRQALGRVLAEPIRADRDQPPFARSTRDGFACRAAEAGSHQFLFLAGQVRAGESPHSANGASHLGPGEVWEIMTGAPVPAGADAVFMVEHAEQNSNFVRLATARTIQAGENVVPQGAEARAGDLLVPRGVRVTPAQMALAAQCGYAELAVLLRPKVAILATGDELVPVEATPGPSQIRNSNAPMLAALVETAGGVPAELAVAADREEALDTALAEAMEADLLLVSGGISAGRFDLVEDALARRGARFFFGGVAIQPGKPVVFGQLPRAGREALPFFALPGNPLSSAVTFRLFAAPLLAALGEEKGEQTRFARAQLIGEWSGTPGLTRFLPAFCDFAWTPKVQLVAWQGSGDLAAFARSNCFVVIPPDAREIREGSTVQILLS